MAARFASEMLWACEEIYLFPSTLERSNQWLERSARHTNFVVKKIKLVQTTTLKKLQLSLINYGDLAGMSIGSKIFFTSNKTQKYRIALIILNYPIRKIVIL